ncbi:MAG: threonine/serine dehydratase [Pseudomonadota bacterium]
MVFESSCVPQSPQHAFEVIQAMVQRTPVMASASLNVALGTELWFKCEHLQHTGSFKYRGASYAVSQLPDDCPGVATHSSGNHGAALAAAASTQGLTADVVMPSNAVQCKIDAVRRYGGRVHFCAPTQDAREHGLARLVKRGLTPIPPYDHDHIILGQSTIGTELLDEHEDLDVIVAPIGGGGMLAGVTLAAQQHHRSVRVIGAEPAAADDAARSLAEGRRVQTHQPNTIADGLRALIGIRNFNILHAHQCSILTVSEAQILTAMATLWTDLKQIVEPSGAVALAAIMNNPESFKDLKVGVVLSGGNLDMDPVFEPIRNLAAS